MNKRISLQIACFTILASLFCSTSIARPIFQTDSTSKKKAVNSLNRFERINKDENKIVAGSKRDFMEVRHLKFHGSHQEIGRKLAAVAMKRHQVKPISSKDPLKTKAQLSYFKKYWPQHVERMKGIAQTWDKKIGDEQFNFSSLPYSEVEGGCTCFFVPPNQSQNSGGIFSRNFDFTTGPFNRKPRTATNPNACSRPYIVELHPENGYSTLAICCFDLMGVVDGINSEGLTIALLADDEMMRNGKSFPSPGPRAGFGVVEIPRYILETCATVEEAKNKLYEAKLYYGSIPCHYLIADANGNSFIWENTAGMNDGIAIDGKGDVQITTNFMQHLHPNKEKLPKESNPQGIFNRYRRLSKQTSSKKKLDFQDVCRLANSVSAFSKVRKGVIPGRTLWHSVYDLKNKELKVSFYLGEADSQSEKRTPYLSFQLTKEK